ncbi:hypothetical protein RCL1_008750 [Eukaryota sp. TZLM3-RCL]
MSNTFKVHCDRLPLYAVVSSVIGILSSLVVSMMYSQLDWSKKLHYISDFGGKYPASVPFTLGLNIAAFLFFISIHLIIVKIRELTHRPDYWLLDMISLATAVFLSLLSIISVYDSKLHGICAGLFFFCACVAAVFSLQASNYLRTSLQNKACTKLVTAVKYIFIFISVKSTISFAFLHWTQKASSSAAMAEYFAVFGLIGLLGTFYFDLKGDYLEYVHDHLPSRFPSLSTL